MKDLKHLIYFENLLQEAQNELVTKAVEDGKRALGYNCYYIPEALLNLPGCFSSRLRAPRCTSTDVASYYMTNRTCPYVRSILERAIEGGYSYLDALFGAENCAAMERMEEHFFLLKLVKKDSFFVTQIDPPMKGNKTNLDYYKAQLKLKVVDELEKRFGVDVSEEAMRAAIADHNEISRVITEIGDYRKLDNPPITGYEFHVIQLVSLTCPKELILPYLRETLEEVLQRRPDPQPFYRARVMVAGSEIDDPEFTKLLESCGAYVVADRYCFGSIPGREEILLEEGKDILQSIADSYLYHNQCPRTMGPEAIVGRKQFLFDLAKEYGAEGIILQNMKFCEYWGYERAQAAMWMQEGFALPDTLPVCQIERDYTIGAAGQLRTRFQAFVESLEIKRIQAGK